MKKLLLTITCVLSVISGYCQYGTTVREDRVWNFELHSIYGTQEKVSHDYGYRFEGTEEKDGVSYARLLNGDGRVVALMRQEDGLIYRYIDEDMCCVAESDSESEILLYNFDAAAGESVSTAGFDDVLVSGYESFTLSVERTYTKTIRDNSFRCMELSLGYEDPLTIVEGVGILGRGWLQAPQFGVNTSGMHWELGELVEVTDLDGKVIFTREDFEAAPVETKSPYGTTVREDRVWNYMKVDWRALNPAAKTEVKPMWGYHFDGTREADGKIYAIFRDGDNKEVAMMREQDGVIYLHNDGDSAGDKSNDKTTEFVLYDFSAADGATYPTITNFGEEATATLVANFTKEIGGDTWHCQTIDPGEDFYEALAIEGIGLHNSMLHHPSYDIAFTGSYNSTAIQIKDVTDLEGNIVFEESDFCFGHIFTDRHKTWEYVSCNDDLEDITTYLMRFEGKVVANGMPYYRFYNYSGYHYPYGLDGAAIPLEPESLRTPCYFREASGCVYALTKDDEIIREEMPQEVEGDQYGEAIVMAAGFLSGTGEWFSDFYGFGIPTDAGNLYLNWLEPIEIDGEKCRHYELLSRENDVESAYAPAFAEVVGVTRAGIPPIINLEKGQKNEYLLSMYSYDGRVLYRDERYELLRTTNGVGNAKVKPMGYDNATGNISAAGSEIAVADLSGKRVAEGKESVSTAGLQPGVYVATASNGKATQTMKILVK